MLDIFIYGDSHANTNFKNLKCYNFFESSITMHRIGRDDKIINFDNRMHNSDSILIICYGEVDCRCHIHQQIKLGRQEDIIISELVVNYFNTLKKNIVVYKKIIVCAIVPPMNKSKFEEIHGPITHEYPFLGDDDERILYTQKMNKLIQQKCVIYDYIYFDPFEKYTDQDGCLKYELSDTICHIKNNEYIIEGIKKLI